MLSMRTKKALTLNPCNSFFSIQTHTRYRCIAAMAWDNETGQKKIIILNNLLFPFFSVFLFVRPLCNIKASFVSIFFYRMCVCRWRLRYCVFRLAHIFFVWKCVGRRVEMAKKILKLHLIHRLLIVYATIILPGHIQQPTAQECWHPGYVWLWVWSHWSHKLMLAFIILNLMDFCLWTRAHKIGLLNVLHFHSDHFVRARKILLPGYALYGSALFFLCNLPSVTAHIAFLLHYRSRAKCRKFSTLFHEANDIHAKGDQ